MQFFHHRRILGFAFSGAALLHGWAGAEVSLSYGWDAEGPFSNEVPVSVKLTISRSDVSADPDSDVTAMGVAWTVPDGWTLLRDVQDDCAPAIVETQNDEPVDPSQHPVVFIRGANVTYLDPPENTRCAPLPATGSVLELNWLPSGGEVPLPFDFPVTVTLRFWAPDFELCTLWESETQVLYRVGDGGEETAGGDGIEHECGFFSYPPGDLNGDDAVDPSDAQLCFEAFLQIPEALNRIVPTATEFCGGSDGADPGDAQGIFNAFLELPNPCD